MNHIKMGYQKIFNLKNKEVKEFKGSSHKDLKDKRHIQEKNKQQQGVQHNPGKREDSAEATFEKEVRTKHFLTMMKDITPQNQERLWPKELFVMLSL